MDDDYQNGHTESYAVPGWIRQELDKISHREYSTGFFFGGEPGQTQDNGGYIRNYEVVAVCIGKQGGRAVVTQRNRFFAGDMVDVLPYSGIPFETKIRSIYDSWGNPVESAPHPMQELLIETDDEISGGAILRKKRAAAQFEKMYEK